MTLATPEPGTMVYKLHDDDLFMTPLYKRYDIIRAVHIKLFEMLCQT